MKKLLIVAPLFFLFGCGRADFEPVAVSGTVKVDDEPRAGLIVTFLPTSKNDKGESGPPSTGRTDAEGEFVLTQRGGKQGATPGSYKVTIYTAEDAKPDRETAAVVSDDVYSGAKPEAIPDTYNTNSELSFEVPTEGTSEANFDITTK